MGYKTRKSIIEGSRYHKDLKLAYGLDNSTMTDGRPKHSAFQKPVPEGLEKAMDSGMPKEVVEKMGFDVDTPMDKYGPYRSEHVKMDTPMNFLGRIKNFNNKDAGNLAKGLMGPAGMFMKTETPMSKVLDEVTVVGEKSKDNNLVDVTEKFKKAGNENTKQHIADGGKVFQDSVTGQLILRKDA